MGSDAGDSDSDGNTSGIGGGGDGKLCPLLISLYFSDCKGFKRVRKVLSTVFLWCFGYQFSFTLCCFTVVITTGSYEYCN